MSQSLKEKFDRYLLCRESLHNHARKEYVGKVGKIKCGRYAGRLATVLDVFAVDFNGLSIHIGIHRIDGKSGYIDHHNESYKWLHALDFEASE